MLKKLIFLFVLAIHSTSFATYYSQCGQDKFANEIFFKNRKNGVFVDIGAHDGIELSNTYFFEKELNWTGLCIEPIPSVFEKLKNNRKCICINGCASNETRVAEFLKISGPLETLSGIIDMYDPQHVERIQRDLAIHGGSYEIIRVQCYNINDLFRQNGITHIDFLSIDTEGGELEILQSIDFSNVQIDVITVENNYSSPDFVPFLKKQGFEFVTSLYQDMIFVNKKFPR
jgi:FkbM family methyltransferase